MDQVPRRLRGLKFCALCTDVAKRAVKQPAVGTIARYDLCVKHLTLVLAIKHDAEHKPRRREA